VSIADSNRKVWGLVPAGGRGERYGGETPKQLITIAGRPLLVWTLERLLDAGLAGVTVALPAARLPQASELVPGDSRIRFVAGGESRQDSVAACLEDSPEDADLVVVHDGARPAVAIADLEATIQAAAAHGAAVLGRRVVDTVKRLDRGWIRATVDRDGLFRAETPQVFRPSVLRRALVQSAADAWVGTDEAAIVERLDGVEIRAVEATRPNPKLTNRQDLALVELLLREEVAR
jgi:2-C-methyl-D-erythritol 4-phosphate cytidylyltransferase